MNTSSDQELNQRLIELSKAVSALFASASSSHEIPTMREEALRTIVEQSEMASKRLNHPRD